jgi:hypothetical protein
MDNEQKMQCFGTRDALGALVIHMNYILFITDNLAILQVWQSIDPLYLLITFSCKGPKRAV